MMRAVTRRLVCGAVDRGMLDSCYHGRVGMFVPGGTLGGCYHA